MLPRGLGVALVQVYAPPYKLVAKEYVEMMYNTSGLTGYGLATFNLTRRTGLHGPDGVAMGHLGATYGYQSIVVRGLGVAGAGAGRWAVGRGRWAACMGVCARPCMRLGGEEGRKIPIWARACVHLCVNGERDHPPPASQIGRAG